MSIAAVSALEETEVRTYGTRRDLHILLVEDFEDARLAEAELLQDLGYRVTAVESAAAARRVRARPDVILTEMLLPDGRGWALATELRCRPSWRHVPCIALSKSDEPTHLELARLAGMDGYLVKPVSIRELDRLILTRVLAPP